MERVEAQIAEYGFAGRVQVVEGGENRQESVAHALAALPAETGRYRAGARRSAPAYRRCHNRADHRRGAETRRSHCRDACRGHHQAGGADGARRADYGHHSARVCGAGPDPPGLPFSLLQRAFTEAIADGFVGTDEASLLERAGIPVAVVHGSQVNLKITQPGDLELAEFYLRQRSQ